MAHGSPGWLLIAALAAAPTSLHAPAPLSDPRLTIQLPATAIPAARSDPGSHGVDDVLMASDHAFTLSVIPSMPRLQDIRPGLWFYVPALELRGLVHKQTPTQTIARLLNRAGRLEPRRPIRRTLEAELIDEPPGLHPAPPREPRRPISAASTPASPAAPSDPSTVPLHGERRRRYCGHCEAERTAYYERLAWRCPVCGYATQRWDGAEARPLRERIATELDRALEELARLAGRPGPDHRRLAARLAALRRDLVPLIPAPEVPETAEERQSRWFRQQSGWRNRSGGGS